MVKAIIGAAVALVGAALCATSAGAVPGPGAGGEGILPMDQISLLVGQQGGTCNDNGNKLRCEIGESRIEYHHGKLKFKGAPLPSGVEESIRKAGGDKQEF